MNPWTIVAALLIAAGLFGGGYYKGNVAGINTEKVRTQGIIDGYNIQVAQQKAEANENYRKAQDGIIATLAERDRFKNQLGEQHVKNQDLTNRLRDTLAAYSLRFRAEKGSGCGDSAGSSEGAKGNAAGDATAAVVQLPDEITRNLRQLVKDADELNDDYKLCYGFASPLTP